MGAIQLPADLERRVEELARQTGRSETDVLRAAIDALAAPAYRQDRDVAHARLMARLEGGLDLGGGRFDRDSLYDGR